MADLTDLPTSQDDPEIAAQLIERLLTDPAFRARFRRNPATACREAGLEDLADEMSLGAGNAMMTLDVRESKSSLAGVMMAAAMEGVGVYEFAKHVAPALDDLGDSIGNVLSHVNLPAISDVFGGAGGGGGAAPAPAFVEPEAPEGADAAAGGGGAAAVAAPPPAAPVEPAPTPEEAAAATDAEKPPAEAKTPEEIAAEISGKKTPGEEAAEAAAKIAEDAGPQLPESTDLPAAGAGTALPGEDQLLPPGATPPVEPESPPPAPPAAVEPTAPAPVPGAPPVEPTASGVAARPIDPSEFGLDGTGGGLTPEADALLKNPNIHFDETGIADLKAGKIDPRVVASLTHLSKEHEITVTCMCSDHSRSTAGGSVSNHSLGRGVDIGTIDGEIVRPNSAAARELASELSTLDPMYRPNEIGSPFAISGAGYFTDAAHQDHIHFGFKEEIPADWKPPADVAAGGAAPVAGVAAVPGAPVVPGAPAGAPAVPVGERIASEDSFLPDSPTASAAADGAVAGAEQIAIEDSFLQPPSGPPTALATDPAAVPGVVDAAAAAAAGSSPLGVSALQTAMGELGVREEGGANMGAKVEEYLAAAGVPPGNPWCASFVTWALEQNGHKMEGGGWAGVATWVQNAREGNNGLQFISPEDARPGDIAVYDWGGQEDFGADGHIGFVASDVVGGKFTALEGNQGDMVQKVPREVGAGGANVKFIRIEGTAPAGGGGAAAAAVEGLAGAAGGGGYPGDDAPKELIAAWMARRAEAAGLPPELPVMASLVESNVQNLNYGDASSVGYFQMLTTIWDQGKYKGYQQDPEKQMQWFIDTAGPLKEKFGDLPPTAENLGTWIADTERPAEQYRGRYALRLEEAKALIEKGEAKAAAMGGMPVAPSAPAVPLDAPGGSAAAAVDAGGGAARPIDPSEFGLDGTGGGLTPESQALLNNPNIHFDETGIADLKAGKIDPRVVATLTHLSKEHEITVTCMCSDHSRATAGGSVSNHSLGRGVDIGTIDGEIVRPDSPAARELASELSTLDPMYRPNEIGSPFAIAQPGYFTDAAHQDHIHFGFKQEIPPDWAPPADVAAGGAAPVAGAAAVTPGAPAAAVGEQFAVEDSFLPAAAAASGAADGAAVGAGGPIAVEDSFLPQGQAGAAAGSPAGAVPPPNLAGAGAGIIDLTGVPDEYPGDDAPKEEVAAWMAKQAEKRGLPPELPLMASLVESGMRNVNHGDADSVGFFQMRVGIWNRGDYAGYPEDPQLQVKWFLDQAEAVKSQRVSRGLPIDDPSQFGEWIADVERPAEQYRGRYQLKLAEATNLLKQAGVGAPAAAPVAPSVLEAVPAQPVAPAGAAADFAAQAVSAPGGGAGAAALAAVEEAKKHMGTAYQWGGTTPEGFDCSGLMQYAYQQAGIDIPRVAEDQMSFSDGQKVDRASLLPGDLVGFGDPSGYVHHIGMYVGDGKFLHAPSTGDVVKISSLDEPYYKSQFTGGMRVDASAPAAGAPVEAAPAPAVAAAAPPPVEPAPAPAAEAADAEPKRSKGFAESGSFLAVKAEDAAKLNEQEKRFHAHTATFLKAIDPATAAAHANGASPEELAAAAAAGPPPSAVQAVSMPAITPEQVVAARVVPIDLADVPADYPGDGASQEELAKWLAKEAEKAGLPPELPVMASLVESGVKNLNFGDADSVGFFQMRVGIWDQGEYAGYADNPGLQAKWFIDQALSVKRAAIAQGDVNFGKDPSQWGEWIADIERPAEQFRGRYQLRLDEARDLLK